MVGHFSMVDHFISRSYIGQMLINIFRAYLMLI